jgi:hypothetical protein
LLQGNFKAIDLLTYVFEHRDNFVCGHNTQFELFMNDSINYLALFKGAFKLFPLCYFFASAEPKRARSAAGLDAAAIVGFVYLACANAV